MREKEEDSERNVKKNDLYSLVCHKANKKSIFLNMWQKQKRGDGPNTSPTT